MVRGEATIISHLLLNYLIRDSSENGNSYNWLENLISLKGRKENVLFNDALNTFYLRLYGKGPIR